METQIGNDISSIEVVRYLLRSQFDRNLVTQYDAQVSLIKKASHGKFCSKIIFFNY